MNNEQMQIIFKGMAVDIEVAGEMDRGGGGAEVQVGSDTDTEAAGVMDPGQAVAGRGGAAHRAGVVDAVHDFTLGQGIRRARRLPGHHSLFKGLRR